jgi:hypothetical protein
VKERREIETFFVGVERQKKKKRGKKKLEKKTNIPVEPAEIET